MNLFTSTGYYLRFYALETMIVLCKTHDNLRIKLTQLVRNIQDPCLERKCKVSDTFFFVSSKQQWYITTQSIFWQNFMHEMRWAFLKA